MLAFSHVVQLEPSVSHHPSLVFHCGSRVQVGRQKRGGWMANHRLRLRQLGLRLGPLPVQVACAELIEMSTPSHSLEAIQLRAQQTLALTRDPVSEVCCDAPDFKHLYSMVSQIQYVGAFEETPSIASVPTIMSTGAARTTVSAEARPGSRVRATVRSPPRLPPVTRRTTFNSRRFVTSAPCRWTSPM